MHRVRATRDGGYLVIVTKDDAPKVAVTLDKDYQVTGTATAKDRAAKAGTADSGKSRSRTREAARPSTSLTPTAIPLVLRGGRLDQLTCQASMWRLKSSTNFWCR